MYLDSSLLVNPKKYEGIINDITCPICQGIINSPFFCNKCQNNFCYKCINKWKGDNLKCPFRCISPEYIQNKFLNRILSELVKFKCEKGCEEIISYNDTSTHFENCKKEDYKEKYYECATKIEILKVQMEDYNDLNNELQETKNELEGVKERNNELENELEEIKEEKENLNNDLEEVKENSYNLRNELNEVYDEKQELEENAKKLNDRIIELEEKLKNINLLETQIKQLNDEKDELTKQLNEEKEKNSDLENKIILLEKRKYSFDEKPNFLEEKSKTPKKQRNLRKSY